MRYSCRLLCAVAVLVSLPACFQGPPDHFASLAELTAYEKGEGYVMVDHLGGGWPAVLQTERLFHDKVEVILANGEVHDYDDFQGYKLKVVKLKGEGNAEIVVVYRSEKKA